MGIRGGVFHLTSPGISFRLPPWGVTAHRESPGFNARPMAGQKYHCPTLRIIALPGAARQLQNVLLAPSPGGDLCGTSGLALVPHLAVGMDWMKCVFGCQGSGKDLPVGKSSEKALLSISHGKAHCSWPFFSFFKKLFQLRIYPLQPARYCGTLHPLCLSDFRLLFLQEVDPPQQILLRLPQGGYRLF